MAEVLVRIFKGIRDKVLVVTLLTKMTLKPELLEQFWNFYHIAHGQVPQKDCMLVTRDDSRVYHSHIDCDHLKY